METQSETVSDCLRSINDIFVHVIRFDKLVASISNGMASEYNCGNDDTPQNSVNLMNNK